MKIAKITKRIIIGVGTIVLVGLAIWAYFEISKTNTQRLYENLKSIPVLPFNEARSLLIQATRNEVSAQELNFVVVCADSDGNTILSIRPTDSNIDISKIYTEGFTYLGPVKGTMLFGQSKTNVSDRQIRSVTFYYTPPVQRSENFDSTSYLFDRRIKILLVSQELVDTGNSTSIHELTTIIPEPDTCYEFTSEG